MPNSWTEAFSLFMRFAPELHRLTPLLERLTSPEAREEQRRRVTAAVDAAQKANESAERTRQAVVEITGRLAAQNSDILARLESSEQRVKELQADIRASADRHSATQKMLTRTVALLCALIALNVIGFAIVAWLKR